MTFDRRIRWIETVTGCTITVTPLITETGGMVTAFDPELDRSFKVAVKLGSSGERELRDLHTHIYRAKSDALYRLQDGKCANCTERLRTYEKDHITRRSKGRDDRMSNTRLLCVPCHRGKHGA